jgi:hypothetical protein
VASGGRWTTTFELPSRWPVPLCLQSSAIVCAIQAPDTGAVDSRAPVVVSKLSMSLAMIVGPAGVVGLGFTR